MAWEKRGNGLYFYRCRRIDGKPYRIYYGRGPTAEAFAEHDERRREAETAARKLLADLEAQAAAENQTWSMIWGWSRTLAAGYLLAAGWYSHNGEWRRVMEQPRTRQRQRKELAPSPEEATDLKARLDALAASANAGDPTAKAELRALLDEHPEVWRQIGDLTKLSVENWTGMIGGKDVLARESLSRFAEAWKNDLLGANPTPTERAVADVAVTARLAVTQAEFAAAETGGHVAVAAFRVKRLDAALHRLTSTLRLLAQVKAASMTSPVPASPPAVGMPRLYSPGGKRKAG